MNDHEPEAEKNDSLRTITDADIVTERKLPRRSFLSASGGALAGLAGLVAGVRPATAQDDPDKRPDDKPRPDDKRKTDDKPKRDVRPRTDDKPRPDDKPRTDDKPKPDDKPRPDDPHA